MNRLDRTWRAAASEHGFVPEPRRRNGHRRFRNPDTGDVVTTSSTPSDVFALKKFIADMRRANRRHTTCDGPPHQPTPQYQLLQAAPPGRPAPIPSGDIPVPTLADLTISSLREFADTLAEQRVIPSAATLRGSVNKVLGASSYLNADRLIDLDLDELDGMLAATRPDLTPNSRRTYLGHLRRIAQMLIDQTAAAHGDTPPVLTRRSRPGHRTATADTSPVGAGQPAAATPVIPDPPVLTIPFPLRPALTITLTLPADITDSEADRLAQMIKLLPVSGR